MSQTTIPMEQNPAAKLWLYSNGQQIAWCSTTANFRNLFPASNLIYRAAHEDNQQYPNGWKAVGSGLADTFIQRKKDATKELVSKL